MSEMTLTQVVEEPREWEGKYGKNHSITVAFTDGKKGEVTTKPENSSKVIAALKELIGKPSEFVVEDQGTFSNGNPKPLRVKEYPGKAQPGGGFGGGFGGKRGLSPEEQKGIHASVALQHAVTFVSQNEGPQPFDVLDWAEQFYNWLRSKSDGGGSGSGSSSSSTGLSQGRVTGSVQGSPESSEAGKQAFGEGVSNPVSDSSSRVAPANDGTGEGAGPTGQGAAPLPDKEACPHPSWGPAPRKGYEICSACGRARKAAA